MEPLSIRDLEKIGQPESIPPDWKGTGVGIDSRKIAPGQIFFCLKGEQTDGHAFVDDAASKGTVSVVSAEWRKQHNTSHPVVVTDDPLTALQNLARNYRRKFDLPVIAITGSNGKTTCKEMIHAVLSTTFSCMATRGNMNNEIGVPLTLLEISHASQVAIVEMGADKPGDIRVLCDIAEPDSGIVTNIGTAHMGKFGSLENIAKTKSELYEYLLADGVRFVNIDDPWLAPQRNTSKGLVTISLKNPADYRGTVTHVDSHACVSLHVDTPETANLDIKLRVPGIHHAMNALMAATVGLSLGVEPTKIEKALGEFNMMSDRLSIMDRNGHTIINDTYNASPESVAAALDTLQRIEATRRIAVLGDMLELGDASREAHEQVGKIAVEKGIGFLFLFGPLSAHIGAGAGSKAEVRHFTTHESLASDLNRFLKEGDAVLVKGSRGMHMEKIIDLIG